MPRKKLTAAAVERIKPPTNKPREEYFDLVLPGFALRVTDKGRKSWCLFYRYGGRLRRMTLGAYPALELAEAREAAREAIKLVEKNIDPALVRAEKREAQRDTFEAVVDDFIERYAKKRQRTWKETERVLKKHCAPWLKRPITSITRRDAYDLLDGFVSAGHEAKARVTLSWLKTLWRWAWKRDKVDSPVMDAVEIEVERKVRERHYDADEVKVVWTGADDLDALERGFVKLLTLLAVRKGELAGMRWSELDDADEPTLWTIPHERTKAKKTTTRKRVYVVPLPPLAQRILKGLPRMDDEDLVFPGRGADTPMHPGTQLKERVRKASGVEDWTFHACRDTVATWLQDQGHSEFERGIVLNHAGGGTVTGDYSHGYPVELKRELLTKWADHIAGLVTPEGATDVLR